MILVKYRLCFISIHKIKQALLLKDYNDSIEWNDYYRCPFNILHSKSSGRFFIESVRLFLNLNYFVIENE